MTMIELKQIYKSYSIKSGEVQALQNINLTINQGDIFGIFGESGAGKSTLLRTVNLLERPTSGEVYVNQINLTALTRKQLRNQQRHIGMIFQHFNLLSSRNAFDNIALPLELQGQSQQVIKKQVNELLELVRLTQHATHYPDQLSGGQKQRVAIARALATKPQVLLCDEATSALDPHSTASILSLLKDINQTLGVTILLITHEMDVIKRICNKAGVLDQGQLIEAGSIIELFAKPKSKVTKQLVQKALHMELPSSIHLQPSIDLAKSCVVRLTFVGDDSHQPLISHLIQKFNITINIIQANIENIQEGTIGFTVCRIDGERQSIHQALEYINTLTIGVEILGYV